MNEALSKYLAIGILLGLIAGFLAYVFTNEVLYIEAGTAIGIIIGAVTGQVISRKK